MNTSKKRKRERKVSKNLKSSKVSNKRFRLSPTNPFYPIFTPNEFELNIKIPREVLIMIFKYVISCSEDSLQEIFKLSRVCEVWRQIILSTPRLWEKIDLKTIGGREEQFPCSLFDQETNRLLRFVRHLDFSKWNLEKVIKIIDFLNKWIDDEVVFQSLTIRSCSDITSSLLKKVFERPKDFQNLKFLDMSALTLGTRNGSNLLTTSVLRTIMEATGSTLISFNLSENLLFPFGACFAKIMHHGHNIEVLDLSNVVDVGFNCPSLPLNILQEHLPKLRIFRAANIILEIADNNLCECLGFPNLEELSIPLHWEHLKSAGHKDEILLYLTKNACKLKLLDIRWSQYITPYCLQSCLSPSIRHLFLSNCKQMESLEYGSKNPFEQWGESLVELDLAWNKSEISIEWIIRAICLSTKKEVCLKKIDLHGSAVSLDAVKILLDNCNKLETINLESCRKMPRGMKRLYNREDIQQLKQRLNSKDSHGT